MAVPQTPGAGVTGHLVRSLIAGLALAALAPGAGAHETHLLIVAGLGGEPEYAEAFRTWSSSLEAAAEKRLGLARSHITYLSESPEKDPDRANGRSTRDAVEKAFTDIAGRSRPGDTLVVILFGHGSGAGEE